LLDLSANGVAEPTVRESIDAGVSVVTFSGDKLLGGPQAGIIAGKKELITRIRRHPLFRALRVDKLTIAALEVTLGAYLRAAYDEIPALRMIRLTAEQIGRRAEDLLRGLRPELPPNEVTVEIVDGESLVGGGSTPSQTLPTKLIRISSSAHSVAELEKRLRRGPTGAAVIARVEKGHLILDLRTVLPEQDCALAKSLAAAFRSQTPGRTP
jgi:L-seryl-tRNA(Ser) seleniumtransferase